MADKFDAPEAILVGDVKIKATMLKDWPDFEPTANDLEMFEGNFFENGPILFAGQEVEILTEGYGIPDVRDPKNGRVYRVPYEYLNVPLGNNPWIPLSSTWIDAARYYDKKFLVDSPYMQIRLLNGKIFQIENVTESEWENFRNGTGLKKYPNQWSHGGWIWDWVFNGDHAYSELRGRTGDDKPPRRPPPETRKEREAIGFGTYSKSEKTNAWITRKRKLLARGNA